MDIWSSKLQNSKFHFVGIGGIGMCGLAEILHNMGAHVSGSDLASNDQIKHLENLGVTVYIGHAESHIENPDVVVNSSAVHVSNPELKRARALKIPVIPRAEALAEIMRLKRGIAVSGTHGKTTTTSLIASILVANQMNPTIVVGGRLDLIQSTAKLGAGDWLVTEADESDGSFHKLSPEIAVITNIGADHLDYFKSFENVQRAFLEFAQRIPFYGLAVVCGDDPMVRRLFESFSKKILFYGFYPENDFRIEGERGHYRVFSKMGMNKNEEFLGELELPLAGKHNALNSLAATAVAWQMGVNFEVIKIALKEFKGVDRRFHFKGTTQEGALVYDDYGHHPTEVRVTLEAFKEKFPDHRLIVYFQPHRYTRTEHLWYEFVNGFSLADILFLGPIYAASEQPIPGVTSARLAQEMKHSRCHFYEDRSRYVPEIQRILRSGDIFLTLGAGDGWKIGMEVLGAKPSK